MNDELKDFELKSASPSGSGDGQDPATPRWPWAVAAAVVLLGVIAFIWLRPGEPEEPVAPEPEAPAVAAPAESAEAAGELVIGEVPSLAESDTWLQGLAAQISSHPQLAEWLLTPELIRGFVVVVDNIAEGVTPRKHLKMVAPEDSFAVRQDDGGVTIDPAGYRRYDLIVDVIDSLDTAGMAGL